MVWNKLISLSHSFNVYHNGLLKFKLLIQNVYSKINSETSNFSRNFAVYEYEVKNRACLLKKSIKLEKMTHLKNSENTITFY